jgi:pimeloyl-ACP methyl ester carboxylesterase
MQAQRQPLGDGTLNCAVGPENGPPLVLFHGVTRCWRDWEPLLPALTERWQVFAVDHRGHGGSSRAGDYRVADYSADAIEFLDVHVPAPALLLGHSLGAMVAAVVAAERPGRVRAVMLEDPPGTTLAQGLRESKFHLQFTNTRRLLANARDVESLARELAAMPVQRPNDGAVVKFGELRDAKAIRFGAECLMQMDPAVLDTLNTGRWLDGLDWFAVLPRVQAPTLLLRADPRCGGMLDAGEADRIATLIPRCTRLDLPGAGHLIHSTQPDNLLALINQFLETNHLLSKGTQP